jgi:hypothetical protein
MILSLRYTTSVLLARCLDGRLATRRPFPLGSCGPARNADFGNMPTTSHASSIQAAHGRTMSSYSECLKEGKKRVGWSVTTGTGIHRRSPSECLFFKSEVRMKIDLRGFHLLMTEP